VYVFRKPPAGEDGGRRSIFVVELHPGWRLPTTPHSCLMSPCTLYTASRRCPASGDNISDSVHTRPDSIPALCGAYGSRPNSNHHLHPADLCPQLCHHCPGDSGKSGRRRQPCHSLAPSLRPDLRLPRACCPACRSPTSPPLRGCASAPQQPPAASGATRALAPRRGAWQAGSRPRRSESR